MVMRCNRSITADYYYRAGRILGDAPERTEQLTVSFAPGVRERNRKEVEVLTPELRISGAWCTNIPVQLTDAQPGEALETIRTEDDAKRKTVPALSIALGYYEPAEVAERGGWLVSVHRKHLAAPSLLVKPTLADPERGLRDRANLAIQQAANEKLRRAQAQERARQRAAEASALVTYQRRSPVEEAEDKRKWSIVLRGGPAASMMAKPRACTRITQSACARTLANSTRRTCRVASTRSRSPETSSMLRSQLVSSTTSTPTSTTTSRTLRTRATTKTVPTCPSHRPGPSRAAPMLSADAPAMRTRPPRPQRRL